MLGALNHAGWRAIGVVALENCSAVSTTAQPHAEAMPVPGALGTDMRTCAPQDTYNGMVTAALFIIAPHNRMPNAIHHHVDELWDTHTCRTCATRINNHSMH